MKNLSIILATFFACAAMSGAASGADNGWYMAADLGQSHFINGNLCGGLPTAGETISADCGDSASRWTAGYQFGTHWGAEISRVNLGQAEKDHLFTAPPVPDVATMASTVVDAHGWVIAGTGTYLFNDSWSVYGRLGEIRARVGFVHHINGNARPAPPVSDTSWHPTYGVGVRWAFIPDWALRLGWDQFHELGNNDVTGTYSDNLVTLGIEYRFF